MSGVSGIRSQRAAKGALNRRGALGRAASTASVVSSSNRSPASRSARAPNPSSQTPPKRGTPLSRHASVAAMSPGNRRSRSPFTARKASSSAFSRSLVYGVSYRARALTAIPSKSGRGRFLLATQSLRESNELHLVELGEQNREGVNQTLIRRLGIFSHAAEVWHVSSPSTLDNLIVTTANTVKGDSASWSCSLIKIDMEGNKLTVVDEITQPADKIDHIQSTHWRKDASGNTLVTLGKRYIQLCTMDVSQVQSVHIGGKGDRRLSICDGSWIAKSQTEFLTCGGNGLSLWDFRMESQLMAQQSSVPEYVIRTVDCSPIDANKLVTGNDCGDLAWWDRRKMNQPVYCLQAHAHWIHQVCIHPQHHQYVISAGSDCSVLLWHVNAFGEDFSSEFVGSKKPTDRELIHKYKEHEESVYGLCWSNATDARDTSALASLSYDGRFIINHASLNEIT